MRPLLKFADAVDWLTSRSDSGSNGSCCSSSLISAGNALMRYTIHYSSNAWLEIQWYMFGAMFLLAAGYALKHEEHVRVDVFFSKMSPRTQAWVDVVRRHPVPDADGRHHRLAVDPDGRELVSHPGAFVRSPAGCCAGRSRS